MWIHEGSVDVAKFAPHLGLTAVHFVSSAIAGLLGLQRHSAALALGGHGEEIRRSRVIGERGILLRLLTVHGQRQSLRQVWWPTFGREVLDESYSFGIVTLGAEMVGVLRGRQGFVAGLAGGVLMAGSSLVLASIPDADGEITACVMTRTGSIRLIDTEIGQTCRRGEQPLSWDQSGSSGGTGQFVLLDGAGEELGVIAADFGDTGGSWCWVVWTGAEFRSYDVLGHPCQNLATPPLSVYYSNSDCTGNAYLSDFAPVTPAPRGAYGIDFPIIKQFLLGVETFLPILSKSNVTQIEAQSVNDGETCSPTTLPVSQLITLGDPLEAPTPLSVAFD